MNFGPNGIQVAQYFEHCVLKAYPDPKTGGDPWTCGWGSTGPDIGPGTVWTQDQADTRFARDIAEKFEPLVRKHVLAPLNQGQFDALVSIISNVGPGRIKRPGDEGRDGIIVLKTGQPSSLLRMLNAGDFSGARGQFLRWVSPGSNVELGLRRRRTAEVALWDGLSGTAAIRLGAAVR